MMAMKIICAMKRKSYTHTKSHERVEIGPATTSIVVMTFPFASYSVLHLSLSVCILIQGSAKSAVGGLGNFFSPEEKETQNENDIFEDEPLTSVSCDFSLCRYDTCSRL